MQSGSLIGQSLEMDLHTYAAPHVTTKTVVVKEAYTEQVLVSGRTLGISYYFKELK